MLRGTGVGETPTFERGAAVAFGASDPSAAPVLRRPRLAAHRHRVRTGGRRPPVLGRVLAVREATICGGRG